MPIWLRAIIFSLEFIGFIILCVFATNKFYKKDLEEGTEIDANKKRKENIIYFSVNFAIIIFLFLFTYPSYVFLSYSKMILVTIFTLISFGFILIFAFDDNDNANSIQQSATCMVVCILILALVIASVSGQFNVDNEVSYKEDNEPTIIAPLMFEENKIGYSCDKNGNIEKYYFYYIENDELFFEQLRPSEVEVIDLKDKDTYVEKQETQIVHLKKEKKETEADYSYTEIDASYKIYLNKKQMTEIKTIK